MSAKTDTQCVAILRALKAGQRLSPLDALERFGCFRLGARIWDLRQQNHPIETNFVTRNGKHFAEYRLPKKPADASHP